MTSGICHVRAIAESDILVVMLRIARAFALGLPITAVVLAAAACVGEDPQTGAPTSPGSEASAADSPANGGDDAEPVDVVDAGVGCDPTKPFGTPVEVDLGVPSDRDLGNARLALDELTIFFSASESAIDGSAAPNEPSEIYIAKREKKSDPWGPSAVMTKLSVAGKRDDSPSITSSGLAIYFSGLDRAAERLFRSGRANANDELDPPTAIDVGGGFPSTPFILPDESALYFAAFAGDASPSDSFTIYRAKRNGSTFDPRVEVNELKSDVNDHSPTLTSDEKTIYFASARSPSQVIGVWMSTRPDRDSSWSKPAHVSELESAGFDAPSWISEDRCRLYFGSNRTGRARVYLAERGK